MHTIEFFLLLYLCLYVYMYIMYSFTDKGVDLAWKRVFFSK